MGVGPGVGVQHVEITENADGQRLDNFLLARFRGVPKSVIYRIIRKGEVRVNKGRARPDTRLKHGDTVRVPPVRHRDPSAPATPSRELLTALGQPLFEDDHLIVLDKPSGLAVHGGTGVESGLIEQLRAARPELGFAELAHRLDRATSGCLVVAKSRQVLTSLHASLRGDEERVDKRYLALVRGRWPGDVDVVTLPVDDREATSVFEVLRELPGATLVRIELLTGRNHQARLHAAGCGHPVAGDDRHGDRGFNRALRRNGLKRLFLHAEKLGFRHPVTQASLQIEAPLPDKLDAVLESLAERGIDG